MQGVTRARRKARRRVIGTLAALGTSAAVLSGCAVGVDPDAVTPEVYVEQASLSSSATAKGADTAREAAAWVERFVLSHSFDKRFMDPQREYTEAELVSAMQGSLSADAMTHWQSEVRKAMADDPVALSGLNLLTYVAADEEPLRPGGGDEEPVRSQHITDVQVSVDEQTQLYSVRLDYGARLKMYDRRRPFDVDATKSLDLLLRPLGPPAPAATGGAAPAAAASAPAAPGAWVIEQYDGDFDLEAQ